MKRIIALLIALLLSLSLTACASNAQRDDAVEAIAADFTNAIVLAKDAFEETFAERTGLSIEHATTMARPDTSAQVVIVFAYASDQGDGEYGYLCQKDESGNWIIEREGSDINTQNLID